MRAHNYYATVVCVPLDLVIVKPAEREIVRTPSEAASSSAASSAAEVNGTAFFRLRPRGSSTGHAWTESPPSRRHRSAPQFSLGWGPAKVISTKDLDDESDGSASDAGAACFFPGGAPVDAGAKSAGLTTNVLTVLYLLHTDASRLASVMPSEERTQCRQ